MATIERTILKELDIAALSYLQGLKGNLSYRDFRSHLSTIPSIKESVRGLKKKHCFAHWCTWLRTIKNDRSKFAHIWTQAVQQLEELGDKASYLVTVS